MAQLETRWLWMLGGGMGRVTAQVAGLLGLPWWLPGASLEKLLAWRWCGPRMSSAGPSSPILDACFWAIWVGPWRKWLRGPLVLLLNLSYANSSSTIVQASANICRSGDNWGGCRLLRCESVTAAGAICWCASCSFCAVTDWCLEEQGLRPFSSFCFDYHPERRCWNRAESS